MATGGRRHNKRAGSQAMPYIESVLFCESFHRDDKGFLTLTSVFQSAPIATLPFSVRFAIAVVVSGLTDNQEHTLHFDFHGPNGPRLIQGKPRQSVTIAPQPTQFFELTINIHEFPIDVYGVYYLELRFDDADQPGHVGHFEVIQPTIPPPSLRRRVQH